MPLWKGKLKDVATQNTTELASSGNSAQLGMVAHVFNLS
jgi:hypothetical protein